MINLTHLTKRFGATVALDDVTFSVAPGTIVGFLGPNGAGKSTCLRSLVGLVRPDSGEATVNGMAYATLADHAQDFRALCENVPAGVAASIWRHTEHAEVLQSRADVYLATWPVQDQLWRQGQHPWIGATTDSGLAKG